MTDGTMPHPDGKLWTANIAKDETRIGTASLLHVLEGVAVATSAPDDYVQPLAQWLRHYAVSKGSYSPLGTTPTDANTAVARTHYCLYPRS
jgi:hypothetical protein